MPADATTFDPAAVVERVLAHDQQAWREFVVQYQRLVWSVVARSFVDVADREDVTQMVFLRLAERLPTLEDPAKLTAFVGSVAKFTAWEMHRHRRRLEPATDVVPELPGDDDASADAVRRQQAAVVVGALDELSEACRHLLRLFFGAELTTNEVAEMLEIKAGTARVRKTRCLAELRAVGAVQQLFDDGGLDV